MTPRKKDQILSSVAIGLLGLAGAFNLALWTIRGDGAYFVLALESAAVLNFVGLIELDLRRAMRGRLKGGY